MAESAGKSDAIRVLVVDDHTLVREAIINLVDAEDDLEVIAATDDADEALGMVGKMKPDVVILDIELLGRSGLVVGKEIHEEYPKSKLIFLTMHRHEEYALRGLRVGAQGYILKTSQPYELLEAVREVSKGGTYITREISDRIARHVARNGGRHAFTQLSEREFQVLCGLAMGRSCKELADQFMLSVKTIYTYRTRLLEKLELNNDIDLLRYVLRHNLLAGKEEGLPVEG